MSKAHLASLCQWWLRGEVKRPPYKQNVYAKWGTQTHSAIESVLTGQPKPKLLAEAERNFSSWMRSEYPGELLFADCTIETAMRLDFKTGEGRIDTNIKGRSYPKEISPFVVWGTSDLVVSKTPTLKEIIDWKTGKTRPVAKGNGQLLSLASSLFGATGTTQIETTIAHISESEVTRSSALVREADIREWREKMTEAIAGVPTSEPQPGPHCSGMFCEQFGTCPATAHIQIRRKDDAA